MGMNQVASGSTIKITLSSTKAAGKLVAAGGLNAMLPAGGSTGDLVTGCLDGEYYYSALLASDVDQGATAYWNKTADKLSDVAASGDGCGYFSKAYSSGTYTYAKGALSTIGYDNLTGIKFVLVQGV